MVRKNVILVSLTACVLLSASAFALEEGRLLRFPDIHKDKVVFAYAGDIWIAPVAGGAATRLTSHEGIEQFPKFCPSGKWIAFTGEYDGSQQVYIVSAAGGEPKQLTYYPSTTFPERFGADNMVYGWTPDGSKVVFRSQRDSFDALVGRLFTVSPEGGLPEPMPMPISGFASFSPDGKKLAYNRVMRDYRPWKRYKGGLAQDVWIFDLETYEIERITDWEGTDNFPMWMGDKIYFNSDRDARLNLFVYDLNTKETTKVTNFEKYDVKFPSQGPDSIVFENGGYLYVLDPETHESRKLEITLPSDRPLTRATYISASDRIDHFDIGREGKRAVFTARGEVFTVPAKHGDIRNITKTPGIREKFGSWSPDGKWIAYLSDVSGEDELYIRSQDGEGEEIRLTTDADRTRFAHVWSPDSSKLAFADKSLRLFYVDVNEKEMVKIDEATSGEIRDYAWSPDSMWIAYSKPKEATGFRSLYLYSLETKKVTKLTNDFTHDTDPAFDPDGKYLFFTSARDFSPSFSALESNYYFENLFRLYAIVLQADAPSPFAPQSDEVKPEEEKPEAAAEEAAEKEKKEEKENGEKKLKIDLEGIQLRVVGFPIKPSNYRGLTAVKGHLFYFKSAEGKTALYIYDVKNRKEQLFLTPANGYSLSPDGKKLLYRSGATYGILDVAPKQNKVGDGKLNLSNMEMLKEPRGEWQNAFNEVWRRYRDYFYAPNMHGVDWPKMREIYGEIVPYVAHRTDLTYLISELVSELGAGHAYVGGGDQPRPKFHGVGLLGATFEATDSGFYRIKQIYAGENWHENYRSPLTEPGVDVDEGDYIIAVDGAPLKTSQNPYSLFVNKVDRTVELTVSNEPSEDGARKATVKPIKDEWPLRYYNWVKKNRDYVTEKTGGRVGYVHIPDMGAPGLSEFVKWYYAQLDKEGLIVDVRFNGGGFVSEMILERLRRIVVGMGHARNFTPGTYPEAAFVGPKVCLTNKYAASDGDIVSYFWKEYKLGPLVGTRTWGGVVGIRGKPPLIDGGYAFVPEFGMFSMDREWIMENYGVDPDIVLDNLPKDIIAGKDPQLDKGIELVLKAMEEQRTKRPESPDEYPIR